MRIIAGKAKGRRLLGPKGDAIRPVLDKVKGAIFNILREVVPEARVLDLFAGIGAIGIEALSRGAAHATFVDDSTEAMRLIRENLGRCGLLHHAHVVQHRIPTRRYPVPSLQFDLIFVDPPYDKGLVNKTLHAIARENLLAAAGIIVVEHSPREPVKEIRGLVLADQRRYGQTLVSFLSLTTK